MNQFSNHALAGLLTIATIGAGCSDASDQEASGAELSLRGGKAADGGISKGKSGDKGKGHDGGADDGDDTADESGDDTADGDDDGKGFGKGGNGKGRDAG